MNWANNKEEFLEFLKQFPSEVTDYEICKNKTVYGPLSLDEDDFKVLSPNSFTARIRCNLKNEDSENKNIANIGIAKEWIKKFSDLTSTCWIVDAPNSFHTDTKKNAARKTWTMRFMCQLSAIGKISPTKRKIDARTGCTRGGLRNMKCGAFITFKVLKNLSCDDAKNSRKQDGFYLVREKPLLAEINIKYDHSHDIASQAALSLNRVTSPQKDLLNELFRDSHGPAEALKACRDLALEGGAGQVELVSANKVPPLNAVKNLYSKFTHQNWGDKTGPLRVEAFKANMADLQARGCLVALNEEPFAAVIITNLMQRAHKYQKSGDIVYCDSTGQLERGGTTCTLMATHTPCGVIPLACAFHDGQSEDVFSLVFSMCHKLLGNQGFYGQIGPKNFMTDKCYALKNALKSTWPLSRQHLCTFHVVQAIRDWLQSKAVDEISFETKKHCIAMFYKVLYSTRTEIEQHEQALLSTCPTMFCEYYTKCWLKCKLEWIRSTRPETMHGSHTNNYVERLNRILKETVLERKTQYNVVQLTSRIDIDLDKFFLYKLAFPSTNWSVKRIHATFATQIEYLTDNKGAGITKLSDIKFAVPSSWHPVPYLVNGQTGKCTCSKGVGGSFCKHLAALIVLGLAKPRNSPLLDAQARKEMAFIGFGKENCDTTAGFYSELTSNKAQINDEIPTPPMMIDSNFEPITQDEVTPPVLKPVNLKLKAYKTKRIKEIVGKVEKMLENYYNTEDASIDKVVNLFEKRVSDVKSTGCMGDKMAQFNMAKDSFIKRTNLKWKTGKFRIKPKSKRFRLTKPKDLC